MAADLRGEGCNSMRLLIFGITLEGALGNPSVCYLAGSYLPGKVYVEAPWWNVCVMLCLCCLKCLIKATRNLLLKFWVLNKTPQDTLRNQNMLNFPSNWPNRLVCDHTYLKNHCKHFLSTSIQKMLDNMVHCSSHLHVGCRWSPPPHRWACGYISAGEHTSYSPIGSKHNHGNYTKKQDFQIRCMK